ncbi:MAG: hypothetical protein JO079_00665 [Frankiaceae bacterium]|nr:hypothetical protein [Frankiaceae bacterium]
MALFSRKRPAPPRLRRWPGPASSDHYVRLVTGGQTADAAEHLRGVTAEDRGDLLWNFSDDLRYDDLLALLETNPDDALLHNMAAIAAMKTAWKIRTGARAEYVSRAQFNGFHAWLDGSEAHAYEAIRLDQADVVPYLTLVTTGRGLQLDLAELRTRFEAGRDRAPHHLELHRQMLQGLCAKWGGSDDAMFAFARSVADAAPDATGLAELVATAHVEAWLEANAGDYWRRPGVKEELQHAAARLGTNVPPDRYQVTGRNMLALIWWKSRDNAAFDSAVTAMGGMVTTWPWEMWPKLGTPVEVVRYAWQQMQSG